VRQPLLFYTGRIAQTFPKCKILFNFLSYFKNYSEKTPQKLNYHKIDDFFWKKYMSYNINVVYLHRVFHGIRFKVNNEDWLSG